MVFKRDMSNPVAILLAAGASTRMRSKRSKLLYEVCGKTIIEHAVRQASQITDEIVVVVGHQREEVEKTLRNSTEFSRLKLKFVHQKEARGTADAVKTALEVLTENSRDLFIMGADSFLVRKESLKKFLDHHRSSKSIVSLMTANCSHSHAYGRIVRNSQGMIERIVEAKDADSQVLNIPEVNTGFYLVSLKVLRETLHNISSESNKSKEFYLTDIVSICRNAGQLVTTFSIPLEEAEGVNTQMDLANTRKILQRRILEDWMLKGISIVDPDQTQIDVDVELAEGVELLSGVQLLGKTKIAEDSTIGPYVVIQNTEIGRASRVKAFSHIVDSQLGAEVNVGPFVRIRENAFLADGVQLGNFVEIKKSQLERGVKANHLAYLGDATIGEKTNIGAGTITCNYDGFNKSKTLLGKGVFIGSNTSLVAPIKIADGAIVGAGSVITEDIEKDALAIERSKQISISQGAERFRKKHAKDKKGT